MNTDTSVDCPNSIGGNGLVARWTVMGDTSGNDVGNCTADDVYVTINTNPFSFVVRRPA